MQLRTIFRGLVAGQWLLALISTPAVQSRYFSGDAVSDAPTLTLQAWLVALFGIALLTASIMASIGMWRFRRWGRTLFVAAEVTSLISGLLVPFLEWPTSAPTTPFPTTPLDGLSGPMTGAIIALAYASPLASEFRRERPARGVADNFGLDATSG
jgi:hypothetical protein